MDANTIAEADLAKLPGMTTAIARNHGGQAPVPAVTALDQFLSGAGLTREQITTLYGTHLRPRQFENASREEILLIPGVGNRMLHEFEEYRPYAALAVFHREIDKYVDDAELARLEQYVFVPIDLNTASDADILTIPGLGEPDAAGVQGIPSIRRHRTFRREIGKYVSKEEVARLERYVTVGKK